VCLDVERALGVTPAESHCAIVYTPRLCVNLSGCGGLREEARIRLPRFGDPVLTFAM
jgi:hypothetical protein